MVFTIMLPYIEINPKKDPIAYFEKLTKYADKHKICLAIGGEAWQNIFKQKKHWTTRKCVHYFPSLKNFNEHINEYKHRLHRLTK